MKINDASTMATEARETESRIISEPFEPGCPFQPLFVRPPLSLCPHPGFKGDIDRRCELNERFLMAGAGSADAVRGEFVVDIRTFGRDCNDRGDPTYSSPNYHSDEERPTVEVQPCSPKSGSNRALGSDPSRARLAVGFSPSRLTTKDTP